MSAFEFVILALATWRVTHLLSIEDGPGDVFKRLRIALGARESVNMGWQADSFFGRLILCPLCTSVWAATGLYFMPRIIPAFLYNSLAAILALSGAASIIHLYLDRSGR